MSKKPALTAGTPDDEKRNSLIDEHDYLTKLFNDADQKSSVLAIVELGIVEAGGRNVKGDRVTKLGVLHVEHAPDAATADQVEKLFTKMYKARTGDTTRPAHEPEPQTALDGMSQAEIEAGSGDDLGNDD